jgi:hypothetical protein
MLPLPWPSSTSTQSRTRRDSDARQPITTTKTLLALVRVGRTLEALTQMLSAADIDLVLAVCERVEPERLVRTPGGDSVPDSLLLSFLQQISTDFLDRPQRAGAADAAGPGIGRLQGAPARPALSPAHSRRLAQWFGGRLFSIEPEQISPTCTEVVIRHCPEDKGLPGSRARCVGGTGAVRMQSPVYCRLYNSCGLLVYASVVDMYMVLISCSHCVYFVNLLCLAMAQ